LSRLPFYATAAVSAALVAFCFVLFIRLRAAASGTVIGLVTSIFVAIFFPFPAAAIPIIKSNAPVP